MTHDLSRRQPIGLRNVYDFIEAHVGRELHDKIAAMIPLVTLNALLKDKHPYLINVGGAISANKFIEAAVDEKLNFYREELLEAFLRKIAAFVCNEARGGRKSRKSGIDLEFKCGSRYYIVTMNTNPSIAVAGQQKIHSNFAKAIKALSTSGKIAGESVIAIECSLFGVDKPKKTLGFQRLCGQSFWKLLSGRDDLYRKMAAPLNAISPERNKNFVLLRARTTNLLTHEFVGRFTRNGLVQRDKLVGYCLESRN